MKKYILILSLIISSTTVQANQKRTEEKKQVVEITVTDNGYEPPHLKVSSGVETILKVTRKTDDTCAKQILIPSKKIKTALPLNKTVEITVGKLEKGKIKFSCEMHMISGVIDVD